MPHYTHRGRSSSSSSGSSHSPAPKHRSRSPPRNTSSAHKSSASSRRDGDSRRRSHSYSPRRRSSPNRRRSPIKQDVRRQGAYRSNRRSPSPRRRSSPSRRRSRSKASRSPARRRSPTSRSRYHGSSPKSSRRAASRERSPTRENTSRRAEGQTDQNEATSSFAGHNSSATRHDDSAVVAPSVQGQASVAQQMLDSEPSRQDWIPGLDLSPQPRHDTAESSTAAVLHSSKQDTARREEARSRDMRDAHTSHDPSRDVRDARTSHDDSRDARTSHDPSRDTRDARTSHDPSRDTRDARTSHDPSRDTRDARTSHDTSRDARNVQDDPRETAHAKRDLQRDESHESGKVSRNPYRSTQDIEQHNRSNEVAEKSSRSLNYSQTRSQRRQSQSPVGDRIDDEHDYNWVHNSRHASSRSAPPPADPVQVSVNLRSSADEIGVRRDDRNTAPWEKKRRDQENYHSQREAERQHAQSHSHDSTSHRSRSETEPAKLPDRVYLPASGALSTSRGSLSSRFGAVSDNAAPFYPTENITVGIQRNLKDGNERLPIKRHFLEAEVVVTRHKGEGDAPLSLRAEFVTREEEVVEERRIVKVEAQKPSREQSTRRENFEVTRDCLNKSQSLTERWRERDSRRVEDSHHRESGREAQKESYRSRDEERRRSPHRDERRVSDTGRSRSQRRESDLQQAEEPTWDRKRGRYEIDPGDLRHNLASKRNRSYDDSRDTHVRSRIGDRDESSDRHNSGPEDFSKREDKYAYEEWKDKPEMIPKGSSYYEHDNRDTYTPRGWTSRPYRSRGGFRGRGRGFTPFRGRSSYRGFGFRGRPFTRGFRRGGFQNWRSKSTEGDREWKHDKYKEMHEDKQSKGFDADREWKHDKFKEMHDDSKDNKDERPTSTTEK